MSIKDTVVSAVGGVVSIFTGLSQAENQRSKAPKVITPGMPELLRSVAAQGAVLLKNDGVLPLKKDSTVSLFGRVQNDWFFTGYGSGGDVNKPYAVNLIDGIRNCDSLKLNEKLAEIYLEWCKENPINHGMWGQWPRFYPEMPLYEKTAKKAAEKSDYAVVVIGRSSGEDRENVLEKGSYYITDEELELIDKVTDKFDKTVVLLNIGCIMDLSWMEKYGDKISVAMIVWQGGMESGNAIADLLSGKVSPSGKLSATVAKTYESFPSAKDFGNKEYNNYTEDIYVGYRYFETFDKNGVQYPFGFGLTYSDFKTEFVSLDKTDEGFTLKCCVTNIGSVPSAYAPQVYVEKPCALLGNPYRELAGFNKTRVLAAGESQELTMAISM